MDSTTKETLTKIFEEWDFSEEEKLLIEYSNLPMQLTDVTTICSIPRYEYLPGKFGRTDGSFSN